jgi:hypothetical protein
MIRVLDLLEEFCDKRYFPCERLDGRVTGTPLAHTPPRSPRSGRIIPSKLE